MQPLVDCGGKESQPRKTIQNTERYNEQNTIRNTTRNTIRKTIRIQEDYAAIS